jgi:hypothetical protein
MSDVRYWATKTNLVSDFHGSEFVRMSDDIGASEDIIPPLTIADASFAACAGEPVSWSFSVVP